MEQAVGEVHIVMWTKKRAGFITSDPISCHGDIRDALAESKKRELAETDPDVRYAVRTVQYLRRPG